MEGAFGNPPKKVKSIEESMCLIKSAGMANSFGRKRTISIKDIFKMTFDMGMVSCFSKENFNLKATGLMGKLRMIWLLHSVPGEVKVQKEVFLSRIGRSFELPKVKISLSSQDQEGQPLQ